MTTRSRYRIAAAVGALVAPMAVVATTSAPADAGTSTHKHEVSMCKVARYLKVVGVGTATVVESTGQSVYCDPGDIVLDGMWSIRNVDKYHPPTPDPDDDPG